ncbi:MAG: TrmH family RNA methyltransferase, partial [Bacteroidota bacterium]
LFVAEGVREVSLALQKKVEVDTLYICRDFFSEDPSYPIHLQGLENLIKEVSPQVFAKMAYRKDTGGILLVAHQFDTSLEDLKLPKDPLIVVLESVQKPGNLGGVLRTCDAAGVDAIIVCDPLTDVFNPNVIRSGVGCLFTRQIAVCTSVEFMEWAKKNEIKIMAASLQTDKNYFETNLTGATALVFGTEAEGLSPKWYQNSHARLKIPMLGKIDSLNVSASVSVLVYEAVRQRMHKNKN